MLNFQAHECASEKAEMSEWLKNILPVPRKKAVLSPAGDPEHDRDWLKNILPLPRKKAAQPHSHSSTN